MKYIEEFPLRKEGNNYVVGDIHGMFTALQKILDDIGFNPAIDKLFSVGDIIDRGPESEDCLKWLQKPWFHSVLANHEQMLIDAYRHPTYANIMVSSQNGGAWFFKLEAWQQLTYVEEFEKLPYAIEVDTLDGKVGIIHAEVFGWDWDKMKQNIASNSRAKDEALWSRTKITYKYNDDIKNIYKVYSGHTPNKEIVQLGNQYYIDTGGCYPDQGGYLSVVKI